MKFLNKKILFLTSSFFITSLCLSTINIISSCSFQSESKNKLNNNGIFDQNSNLTIINFNKSAKFNFNNVLNTKKRILDFLNENKKILFNKLINNIIECNIEIDNETFNKPYSSLILNLILDNHEKFKIRINGFGKITKPTNEHFVDLFFEQIKIKKIPIFKSFNLLNSNEIYSILNKYVDVNSLLQNTIKLINNDETNAYIFNELDYKDIEFSLFDTPNYRQKIISAKINNLQIINGAPINSDILINLSESTPTIDFLKPTFNAKDNLFDIDYNLSIKANQNILLNLNNRFLQKNSQKLFGINSLPNIIYFNINVYDYYQNNCTIKLIVKFENEPTIVTTLTNFKPCIKMNKSQYLSMLSKQISLEIDCINTFDYDIQAFNQEILLNFINKNNLIQNAMNIICNQINNDNYNDYYLDNINQTEIILAITNYDGFEYLNIDLNNECLVNDKLNYITPIKIFTKPKILNNINLSTPSCQILPNYLQESKITQYEENNINSNNLNPPQYSYDWSLNTLNILPNIDNMQLLTFDNFNQIYDDLYTKYQTIINSNNNNLNAQMMFESDLNAWVCAINQYSIGELNPLNFDKLKNTNLRLRTYNRITNLNNIKYNKETNSLNFNFELIGINEIYNTKTKETYAQLYTINKYEIIEAYLTPILLENVFNNQTYYISGLSFNKIEQINFSTLVYEIKYINNELINQSLYKDIIISQIKEWNLLVNQMKNNLNIIQSKKINVNTINISRYERFDYQSIEENCLINSLIKFINFKNPHFTGKLFSPFLNTKYLLEMR